RHAVSRYLEAPANPGRLSNAIPTGLSAHSNVTARSVRQYLALTVSLWSIATAQPRIQAAARPGCAPPVGSVSPGLTGEDRPLDSHPGIQRLPTHIRGVSNETSFTALPCSVASTRRSERSVGLVVHRNSAPT